MANLKKEVMSLISRFDAAQEAFISNTVDVKKVSKKYKKELKAAKKEAKAAQVEVEALKAELAMLKSSSPARRGAKSTAKRSPGRPKRAATTSTAAKPAASRGRGRPKKSATIATAAAAKPAKKTAPKAAVKPAAKSGPGRPKKATSAKTVASAKKATVAKASGPKKRPGRPRTKPAVESSALQAVNGVGPALAKQFEAAGIKTPAALAKLSNVKMGAILANCGPRYRNADAAKMQAYRDAATAAK